MTKKILISAVLMAMTFFWIPSGDNNAVSAQKNGKGGKVMMGRAQDYRGRHNGVWRKKPTYGYKNYGQYRKTQVGNRRYRMVKRGYWQDGVRRFRSVRNYY